MRRQISVTGQYAALDESLTGWQNLTLFAGLHGYSRKDAHALAEKLLKSFKLEDAGSRTAGTYSGGKTLTIRLAEGTDSASVSRLLASEFKLTIHSEEDGAYCSTLTCFFVHS
ncbi:P-loop NTPase family protein [Paenibacillus ihumii]|uniref:hypothetical protein n=1 Tax=Paenibacillus ihumii TaxID=687436 RepID=UPI001E5D4008|nr:hypothetical protein [Paenibacillus ihumii]